MEKKLENAIEELTKSLTDTKSAFEAQQFAQAIASLAHALTLLRKPTETE